jgi:hypothetical protein
MINIVYNSMALLANRSRKLGPLAPWFLDSLVPWFLGPLLPWSLDFGEFGQNSSESIPNHQFSPWFSFKNR